MSNLVWVGPQKNKTQEETICALLRCKDELMVNPKTIVGDKYCAEPKIQQCSTFHGVRFRGLGPMTPWPNRAEAAVKWFK
eukprot:12934400-Prorocentrum_lima.AAC.1